MTNETMSHAMAEASDVDVDSPDAKIVSAVDGAVSRLTFHQAWGAAKDRVDYHKPDWNRAQSHHESESWTMSTWTEIVRAAPGRVDIRDTDRPEPSPLTKASDDLGLNTPEPAPTANDSTPVWSSEWPTVPGWYWLTRFDRDPECAQVLIAGSGNGVHIVYLIAGGFSYPRERPGALWGPRIPEPETLDDQADDPSYQRFIADCVKDCRCEGQDVPCGGVTAGGPCDGFVEEPYDDDPWDDEEGDAP